MTDPLTQPPLRPLPIGIVHTSFAIPTIAVQQPHATPDCGRPPQSSSRSSTPTASHLPGGRSRCSITSTIPPWRRSPPGCGPADPSAPPLNATNPPDQRSTWDAIANLSSQEPGSASSRRQHSSCAARRSAASTNDSDSGRTSISSGGFTKPAGWSVMTRQSPSPTKRGATQLHG